MPDCFWDNESLEDVFQMIREYFNIDKRIEVLNNRLNLMKELFDMLNNEIKSNQNQTQNILIILLVLLNTAVVIGAKFFN